MKFEIKQKEDGHYDLYVDGEFYKTCDTALEAANVIEQIKRGEN